INAALIRAVERATKIVPLRSNTVHPLTRTNSGNNVGENIPNIVWLYADVDEVELTAFLKGAGSENMSKFSMINLGLGVNGIKKFVLDSVVEAWAQPCPPIILGIGIGGTVDLTYKLAKLALLRPIGQRNTDVDIANLEVELLNLVNETGIGPMGLGGKTTALDVRIESAYCHTASLPVGINFECWADRKMTARIHVDNTVEYLA
ncbi:MAG: fumarate hydratase, partial [Candidatus Bathyarchaeota archaeon]